MKKYRTPYERFWAQVDLSNPDGCWPKKVVDAHGYSSFALDGKAPKAHRVSYEWYVGEIPDGYVVDHRCYNPSCVRPDHLEAVTPEENRHRQRWSANGIKTHCPQGHPYDEENTYVCKNNQRHCRQCGRDKNNQRYRELVQARRGR